MEPNFAAPMPSTPAKQPEKSPQSREGAGREEESAARNDARNPFFHHSVNISEWMRDRIAAILEKRELVLVSLDCNAEVMARMSNLTVINNVNLEFRDAKGGMHSFNNYSSVNKYYDGPKDTSWLVDQIKEAEMEAVLKYGGKALRTEDCGAAGDARGAGAASVGATELRNTEEIVMELYASTTVDEMARFLTDRGFIERWTCGRARFDDSGLYFENLRLEDIRLEGGDRQGADRAVSLRYRWQDWEGFSRVRIALMQAGNCTKLTLRQSDVPVDAVDMVRRHWNEEVFGMISRAFNCAVRQG